MAIPIFAIICIGAILVFFAVFKDEILTILKELAIDFVFGFIFTIIIDLIIPLNKIDLLLCIGIISTFIFIIHAIKAPAISRGLTPTR